MQTSDTTMFNQKIALFTETEVATKADNQWNSIIEGLSIETQINSWLSSTDSIIIQVGVSEVVIDKAEEVIIRRTAAVVYQSSDDYIEKEIYLRQASAIPKWEVKDDE